MVTHYQQTLNAVVNVKENKMYIKSIHTNQVYKVEEFPMYGGYIESTREEYEEFCRKNGVECEEDTGQATV